MRRLGLVVAVVFILGICVLNVNAEQQAAPKSSPQSLDLKAQIHQELESLHQQAKQVESELKKIEAQAKPLKKQLRSIREKMKASKEKLRVLGK